MKAQFLRARTGVRRSTLVAFGLIIFAVSAGPTRGSAWTSEWYASSGSYPDELGYPYVLLDTSPNDPSLSAGTLTLNTVTQAEMMGYSMPTLGWPDTLVVEASVKYASGVASVDYRTPITIGFIRPDAKMNALYVGDGEIFLLEDKNAVGDSAAVVTTDDFHTYRIEVTASGAVSVYYDEVLTLQDDLFLWSGETEKIYLGDTSSVASGVSEWEFVRHNAVTPEPAMAVLLALGCLLLARRH